MSRLLSIVAFVALLSACNQQPATTAPPPQTAQTAPEPPSLIDLVKECDLLAAHPDDPKRMAEGVADDKIVPRLAIMACEQSIKDDAADPRHVFQLGRALLAVNRKKEAFEQFQKAAAAGHAAAHAYLGDAYQFGHGVEVNPGEAFTAYQKALEGGFERAKTQIDQLQFDNTLYVYNVIDLLYTRELASLARAATDNASRWPARGYLFAMTQKFIGECGKIVAPANIERLYRLRYVDDHTPDVESNVELSIRTSIAESDADTFLKRHGCEGPMAKHIFTELDRFLSSRS